MALKHENKKKMDLVTGRKRDEKQVKKNKEC